MAEGCPEGFDWAFVKWIIGYRRNHRREVVELLESAPETIAKYRLTSPAAVDAFLAGI